MKKKQSIQYLTKHTKYIDYRIARLQQLFTNDNSNEIIGSIIEFLTGNNTHNKAFAEFPEAFEAITELYQLISKWEILTDGDILGYIYQGLEQSEQKKKKGQYFTPGNIVDHITGQACQLAGNKHISILDPACGSGQFLISAFKHLLSNSGEQDSSFYRKAQTIVKQNIFGFDLDPIAVKIARFNLAKISGCQEEEVNIHHLDFLDKQNSTVRIPQNVPDKYDIILGNPPWGSKLEKETKKYYRKQYTSSYSGINTFTLFIERAFDFLKHNGHLAYLIPEAYLNIKAHRSSRSLLLEKAKINNIVIWGEQFKGVFAPSISLVITKEKNREIRDKNIISIINSKTRKDNTSILAPQASYYNSHENIFNINYSRRSVSLISSIENQDCFNLKGKAKFFLGIVTGNNDLHLHDRQSEEYPDPIIIGKDVTPYNINFSNHYFKYCGTSLQQVAPQHLYRTKDKVLYKFIGKKLTFAIEKNGYYTLNNVNGFIPEFNFLNNESLISILNSPVMQYYYENNFFTVKVLRGNLERLPIKLISKENQERIRQLLQDLSTEYEKKDSNTQENINDIIFHEYGINDRQAYTIAH